MYKSMVVTGYRGSQGSHIYNLYCMHDTITTASLLENGPLLANQ